MLAGQMSNADEDEVEDELEALQREVEGPAVLPDAPSSVIPEPAEAERAQKAKERAQARARGRAAMQLAA
jgi:charged multivesicular body protein 6